MKLPFDLGVKLIFRLLVPGFLLTLGLYPILATIREKAGWTISTEYLFILSVVITGWLVVTMDQPIYMFLEGRRFWPKRVRAVFIWTERRRLERLLNADNKFFHLSEASKGSVKQNYNQRYLEASVEERKFPFDKLGRYEARFPTRLGNLIDSYESYPNTRYGIDAVFYWYRIWLRLDKDLREELDTRQALADSSIYASVTLFVSGLLWIVYARFPTLVDRPILDFPKDSALWVSAGFLILSYLLYRVALYPQAQYGESFKSVFDAFEKQIDVKRVLERVADITGRPEILNEGRRNQLLTAWRYLHNYKVKCPMSECAFRYSMSPEELEQHYEKQHGTQAAKAPIAEPDFATYRTALSFAFKDEKRVLRLKVSTTIVSFLLLGFGIYKGMVLVIAGVAVSLVILVIETWIRKDQKHHVDVMDGFENTYHLPHIYEKLSTSHWRNPRVLFPHLFIIVLGLAVLILSFTGLLPYLGGVHH